MSVNSVSNGLSPSNSLLSGNSSRTVRAAARAGDIPERVFAKANPSQGAAADVRGVPQDAPVPGEDAANFQFRSNWEKAPRTSGATDSTGDRSSPGIAVYQRISQYGNSEPSASALLKSWNTIMQGGRDTDSAATAVAKRLLQNEAPGSGVLDLTA